MDSNYNPKLALIEAETRHRLLTADEPNKLEGILRSEEEKTVELKKKIDAETRAVNSRERDMLSHLREARFFQDKIDKLDQNKLRGDQATIEQLRNELSSKQAELKRLRKSLEEFAGMEPTEFDLKQRIEDLKASRLSLEMTFVGDSP